MDIEESCTICLITDMEISKSVMTPCNHRFCTKCFFTWIYNNKTCPLCRKTLIRDMVQETSDQLGVLRNAYRFEYEIYTDICNRVDDKNKEMGEINKEMADIKRENEKLERAINRQHHKLNQNQGRINQERINQERINQERRRNSRRIRTMNFRILPR